MYIHIYIHIFIFRHEYIVWLVVSTPLENMEVSWDYEIPNIWKSQTTNQQLMKMAIYS